MAQTGSADGGGVEPSLKEKGNEFFKAGNYLKAAALYTQAIKQDPNNAALYRLSKRFMNMLGDNDITSALYELKRAFKSSNRAAAFLHLVKLSKALSDAETTITLNPQWEKGYFRKGCIFEAMERYEESLSAFEAALQHNPQSSEVVKKIKRVIQLVKDKRRAEEVEELRSNVQMEKHLDTFKTELCASYGLQEESKEVLSFVTETMECAAKSWHETSKVDPRVYFFLDLQRTETEKYASVVNIDKAFESPQTHSECFTFLRKYTEDSFSKAACLVSPKNIISYPQVWKGQGSRKWKHGLHDGFFIQFESPFLRKLWFIPSSTEKGKALCRDPVALDISAHELLPRIFKEKL